MKSTELFNCPVEATLSLISGKYKPIILYHLLEGDLRFSALQKFIPQATAAVLTKQLRELEEDKLITRKVFAEVPPHVEYAITDYGRTLSPVLTSLCEWGKEHLGDKIKNLGGK